MQDLINETIELAEQYRKAAESDELRGRYDAAQTHRDRARVLMADAARMKAAYDAKGAVTA